MSSAKDEGRWILGKVKMMVTVCYLCAGEYVQVYGILGWMDG